MFKKKIKYLFCKHNYKPWANVHGDFINWMNCRTVLICTKCGKRKFIKDYIEAPLNYNNMFNYIALKREGRDDLAESYFKYIIKDEKLFLELFGDNNEV